MTDDCQWCGALEGEPHNYATAHPCTCWRCTRLEHERAPVVVCKHADGTEHLAGYLHPIPCPWSVQAPA